MPYDIQILNDAEKDFDEAYIWYESKQIGLGIEFIDQIDLALQKISRNPQAFQKIFKKTRRYIIGKFPFGLYYLVDDVNKEIKVIAVLHFKRSPKSYRKKANK